jgi:hypothetical protein
MSFASSVRPLSTNERAESPGYTHMAVLTCDDLTTTTNGTAQAFTIALATGDVIGRVQDYVKTPFQVAGTAGNDTTLRSLGDNSSATTHTATAEMNANGTVVYSKFSNTAVGPYTAANTLKVTVTPKTGTNVNALNRGELHVFFQVIRVLNLVNATGATTTSK